MTPSIGETRRVRLGLESLTERVVPAATHFYAVGQDFGGTAIVHVYGEDGGLARLLIPFGLGFSGGARVATGDVTGDGTDDVVVAPGPGGGPEVKVFDGATGEVVRDFFAYDPDFRGGVNVAVGDVNADGRADVVTGTGVGGGPHVEVFDGATGGLLDSFFAYEPSFRGGVNVAASDVNGDGRADVVTGTGVGGGPRVQVFDGATAVQFGDFFAYGPDVRTGVTVGAGDLNGDGRAEIVTGTGFGGGPHVQVFDGATNALTNGFFAYDAGFRGGVSVGVVHANGANQILVAPGPSAGGYVELFGGNGGGVSAFQPFPVFQGGITTGHGAATPTAPTSTVFARPVAPAMVITSNTTTVTSSDSGVVDVTSTYVNQIFEDQRQLDDYLDAAQETQNHLNEIWERQRQFDEWQAQLAENQRWYDDYMARLEEAQRSMDAIYERQRQQDEYWNSLQEAQRYQEERAEQQRQWDEYLNSLQ